MRWPGPLLRFRYAPDNALVDRRTRAQDNPTSRALNPRGPIFETAAILLWLSETTGGLAPAPGTPGHGAFLAWMVALSNGKQADLRQMFHPERYAGPEAAAIAAHRGRTIARIGNGLDLFETLAGTGHDWFCGPEPSLLDLHLAEMLCWCAAYPDGGTDRFDLAERPRRAALAARIEARPAMRRGAAPAAPAPPAAGPHGIIAAQYRWAGQVTPLTTASTASLRVLPPLSASSKGGSSSSIQIRVFWALAHTAKKPFPRSRTGMSPEPDPHGPACSIPNADRAKSRPPGRRSGSGWTATTPRALFVAGWTADDSPRSWPDRSRLAAEARARDRDRVLARIDLEATAFRHVDRPAKDLARPIV